MKLGILKAVEIGCKTTLEWGYIMQEQLVALKFRLLYISIPLILYGESE